MDPEPALFFKLSSEIDYSSESSLEGEKIGSEDEDPFSLSGPWLALLGLTIAVATLGIPLAAVLTDRPSGGGAIIPTALEINGPQPSLSVSVTRVGEPGRRNTSRQ